MAQRFSFTVSQEQSGGRLDQVLAQAVPELSRGKARQLLTRGAVFVDARRVKVASRTTKQGQHITVHFGPQDLGAKAKRKTWSIPVLALNQDYVVVDKPSGLVSAPTPEADDNDLVYWVRAELRAAGTNDELFVVHRLDLPTSGLMVLARNRATAALLSAELAMHRLDRQYLALMLSPPTDSAVIDAPIGGKPAVTRFSVLERRGCVSLVLARLETGRTHQVRLHAEAWGAPIWGDAKYGRRAISGALKAGRKPVERPPRLALHAFRLTLATGDGGDVSFESPLPSDLLSFWQAQLGQ